MRRSVSLRILLGKAIAGVLREGMLSSEQLSVGCAFVKDGEEGRKDKVGVLVERWQRVFRTLITIQSHKGQVM